MSKKKKKSTSISIECDNIYCHNMGSDRNAHKFLCYNCYQKFIKSSRKWNACDAVECKVIEIDQGRKIQVPKGFSYYSFPLLRQLNQNFYWR